MSAIFNAALAEGFGELLTLFGEVFYARPKTPHGAVNIGPFTGIFSEVRADAVETDGGFVRILMRTVTTSSTSGAIIERGLGASIEDPQGVIWKIRRKVIEDRSSVTFELWKEGKA